MSELPPTYWEKDGGRNCRHVFIREEHDDGPQFFCALNAPPRPPCMSVYMGEAAYNDDTIDSRFAAWDAWSEPREVKAYGMCDQFEITEQPEQE